MYLMLLYLLLIRISLLNNTIIYWINEMVNLDFKRLES